MTKTAEKTSAVQQAETYYDSTDADNFYKNVWGGEDIHIGLYESDDEPIKDASHRTVLKMIEELGGVDQNTRVVDVGAGYGGSGRVMAKKFGCHVTSLNLSETQNALNRELNAEWGVADRHDVVYGDFENLPFDDGAFDVCWSQDAFLHSGNRIRVLEEIRRVLKPGGQLIFTDPMQADDCPDGVLQPILDRIHLETLGSFAFYEKELTSIGFEKVNVIELTHQLRNHYNRVRSVLTEDYDRICQLSSKTYVDNMIKGLGHWVDGADKGYLAWGIMHYRLKG